MSSKIDSLTNIDKLGLNHHNYVVVYDIAQADYLAKKFKYKFSVRTDKLNGYNKDLPFFLFDNEIEYFCNRKMLQTLLSCNYTLIFSDGHLYDDFLKYNMVLYIDRNGDFIAEYSAKNVSLRHMYQYPNELSLIRGNINERYCDWCLSNIRVAGIDVRIIREKIYEQFLIIDKFNLYGRYLEMSVYMKSCGVNNSDTVYWEI